MTFETFVFGFCDRFLSQRTFELVIAPALADLEFEEAAGRRSRTAIRGSVLRALAGGVRHDLMRASGAILRLTILSACYYVFPVAVSIRLFKTWSEFFVALTAVLLLSLVPVMVCFWPTRYPVRPGN